MSTTATETPAATANIRARLEKIEVSKIKPSPHNPRNIDPKSPSLKDLATSIKELGLLEPILVREVGDTYQLIAGERRWRAAKIAELEKIEAKVVDITEAAAIAMTVTDNLQREDLTVLEECAGVASLASTGWNVETIAEKLGKPPSWVARRSRIHTNIDPAILKSLKEEKNLSGNISIRTWSTPMLEELCILDKSAQIAFLQHINTWNADYKYVKTQVAQFLGLLHKAPWKLDDATLDPKAGPCTTCLKRASCTPGLFAEIDSADKAEVPKADKCLDPLCWQNKQRLHVETRIPELLKKHPTAVKFTCDDKAEDLKATPMIIHADHEWTKKKETWSPYPVLGVWIDGPRAGEVDTSYTSDERFAKDKPKAKKEEKPKPAKATTPKQAEKLLDERKQAIYDRRNAFINQNVMDLVKDKYPHQNMTKAEAFKIIALAIAVGCHGDGRRNVDDRKHSSVKTSDDPIELAVRAWSACDQFMRDWLKQYTANGATAHIANTKFVAELLRLKWDELEMAAVKEIPDPKSWAKLEAIASGKK